MKLGIGGPTEPNARAAINPSAGIASYAAHMLIKHLEVDRSEGLLGEGLALEDGAGQEGGDVALALALAVRAADLGVWDWDLVSGAMNYSARAREICGFAQDGPINIAMVRAVTHPDDLPRTSELARRALDPAVRAADIYRYRIVRADNGEIRWVVAHGEAVFAEREGALKAIRYIGTLQDITEQKLAEDALLESEARLRLAMAASRMAVWEVDLTSQTIVHSPELNVLCGFPPEARPTLEEFRSRYAPGERERLNRDGAAALARGETQFQSEMRQIWPDGTEKWMLLRAQFAPAVGGPASRVIGVLYDITDRKQAEDRFREMADSAPVMIWMADEKDYCTYMSRSWYDFTGQAPGEALGRGWLDSIHPQDRDRVDAAATAANAARKSYHVEYRLRRRDGTWRWALDTAAARSGTKGEFLGHIGSIIDITDRKLEEERRNLLINELNHRVKNTLATVQSIASQTLRGADVRPTWARHALEARLVALAKAHDVLTRENWEGALLKDIIEQTLSPFRAMGEQRIAATGPYVRLSPKSALALSMAMHELATNATKYGSLSNEKGRVDILWSHAEREREPFLRLTWTESGGPPVSSPARKGFGSRLIERSLAGELGGCVRPDFAPGGFSCAIETPLANLTA
jgi:PAS domain S-box-containing protein